MCSSPLKYSRSHATEPGIGTKADDKVHWSYRTEHAHGWWMARAFWREVIAIRGKCHGVPVFPPGHFVWKILDFQSHPIACKSSRFPRLSAEQVPLIPRGTLLFLPGQFPNYKTTSDGLASNGKGKSDNWVECLVVFMRSSHPILRVWTWWNGATHFEKRDTGLRKRSSAWVEFDTGKAGNHPN